MCTKEIMQWIGILEHWNKRVLKARIFFVNRQKDLQKDESRDAHSMCFFSYAHSALWKKMDVNFFLHMPIFCCTFRKRNGWTSAIKKQTLKTKHKKLKTNETKKIFSLFLEAFKLNQFKKLKRWCKLRFLLCAVICVFITWLVSFHVWQNVSTINYSLINIEEYFTIDN